MVQASLSISSSGAGLKTGLQGYGLCNVPSQKLLFKAVQTGNFWRHEKRRQSIILNSVPLETVSAVGAVVVVGASISALMLLNKDTSTSPVSAKKNCETCDGSGICSTCNGEGFEVKKLSAEAAAKARANAENAATRYTAGLAKKWNYCSSCGGSRKCIACDGRGRVNITPS